MEKKKMKQRWRERTKKERTKKERGRKRVKRKRKKLKQKKKKNDVTEFSAWKSYSELSFNTTDVSLFWVDK